MCTCGVKHKAEVESIERRPRRSGQITRFSYFARILNTSMYVEESRAVPGEDSSLFLSLVACIIDGRANEHYCPR